MLPRVKLIAVTFMLALTSSAPATWSIVIADSQTKEIAVGTVTCLTNLDLLALVPVVVVGKGGAAVQAAGDYQGFRRALIFQRLELGYSPQEILDLLAQLSGHEDRQFGIVDTQGRMVTFSGSGNYQWAGGVIGNQGSMVYAIQGNILVGDCVVAAIEDAVLNTPGDVPAKLMAGMVAAGEMGGDGRCSCSPSQPMSCGCPPESFDKPGHIGGMVVSRSGDIDDTQCNASGCVDGDYFMHLNVPYQFSDDPDPVIQLQALFDEWRAALTGRPDAIQTQVEFTPVTIPPSGSATTTMQITLLDWRGEPISATINEVSVEHADDSAGISSIGTVTDNGGGSFSVVLTAGTTTGIDRFTVRSDDGNRPVILMPTPSLRYYAFGDANCDGIINAYDIDKFICAVSAECDYESLYPACNRALSDCNQDGQVDAYDIDAFIDLIAGG
ncbi:MAG: DUF1028 domain-containing protein [Planctomycetota bacterium]